jgi:diphthamide synthase (EF-2-diphthine--ammonia ligase)
MLTLQSCSARAPGEAQVARFGMSARFPLWQRDTDTLAREFLRLDYRAVVACVDTERLPAELAGQPYDAAFLDRLPDGVDPAGEHGEFHTFVYDGPLFRQRIRFEQGDAFVLDGRFAVRDLLVAHPARRASSPRA